MLTFLQRVSNELKRKANDPQRDIDITEIENKINSKMPIASGTLENYTEKLVTLSGTSTAINLSSGNVFRHTLTGNTTYSITNTKASLTHSFTLIVTQPSTSRTITFPASVKWAGGTAPTLTTVNKTYIITFVTVTGGTTWYAVLGGEF